MLSIHPLTGIGEVGAGDDLAILLAQALRRAGLTPEPCDILVVTSKIASKAEGRHVDLATARPDARIGTGRSDLQRPEPDYPATALVRPADQDLFR